MQLLADELEHIDIEPVPPAPAVVRRVSRGWIAALLVVVFVLGAVVAVPGRTALAKAGFRHADRILVTGHTLALKQQRLLGELVTRSQTGDAARLRSAESRLRRELAARYAELRRSLRRDWRLRLDGQTDLFRFAVQRTLEPPVGDPAIASEAEYRARSLRERWRIAKPSPDTDGLHSVDADVAALRRYTDRATGVRLIIGGTDGFADLDLDASTRVGRRGPYARPDQPQVARTLPGSEIASAGDLVAWVEPGPAPVTHVTDLSDGTDVATVPLWGTLGAFSPDGRRLALGSERSLVVLEVATGRVDHVPVTQLDHRPTWDPSGRFLFFQAGRTGGWDAARRQPIPLRFPELPTNWILLAALEA